jgi:hypothetical protein
MAQEVATVRTAWFPASALAISLAAGALPAAERDRFEMSVVVDGSPATEYPFAGRTYIEAIRGRSFAIRLHNPTGARVAVALSVDGLDVVDARRTTALAATKWILEPWQTVEIPGWQVSGEASRRFFFTETGHSYAKWIGDTRNVGTIEAVFFRERMRAPRPLAKDSPSPLERQQAPAEPEHGAAGREGRPSSSEGVVGGVPGGVPGPEADRFAATGIGERTSFPVRWVDFQEDPSSPTAISLRYEFRRELVRLGVLSGQWDLYARDRGRGFERQYAPEPDRR